MLIIDNILPSNETDYYNEEIFKAVQQFQVNEELTYKEICIRTNQPRYCGNQKKAQLKEFQRYFRYEKTNKYIIKEIYKYPLLPEMKIHVNSVYSKHIKQILLTYLLKQDLNHPVYISSQKLFLALGMVNENYILMQQPERKALLKAEIKKNCNFEDIREQSLNYYIKDFYHRSGSKCSSIIKSSLDSLEKQNYIIHTRSYHIYKRILDVDGKEIEIYEGGHSTDEETSYIQEIEREVMDLFGYQYEREIWMGDTKKYFAEVTRRVQVVYPEIYSIYRAHKILCTKQNIIKALNQEEETKEMKQLNEKIVKYIDMQAESTYEKSLTEEDYKKRLSHKYLDTQYYLSDRLIKIK